MDEDRPPPEFVSVTARPDAHSPPTTTEIATWRLGPASGDSRGDVVICHGTPWSSRMWWPLARTLSSTHSVFLWDMPGYGASIAAAEAGVPVDLVAQRRRLAELVRLWDLERPDVIAHDIGGAVALGAHLLEGTEFSSLHLSDIVTLPPWGSPFFRLVADNEAVFAALPPPLHEALVHAYITGAGGPRLPEAWVDELARPWSTQDGQAAFYAQIGALSPADTEPIAASLGTVRCPVRIGWGEEDPWIPVEQAGRLAEALPAPVGVTRFPGVGHLAVLEAPEDFTEEVTTWLEASSA